MRRYDRDARVDKLAKSADLKSAARKSPTGSNPVPGILASERRARSSAGRVAAVSTDSAQATETLHGGRLIARRLKAHGVSRLFTLSGGHLFSIYDGCREEGIAIVDVRHESTAAFAAEGWAKVTREAGGGALTAGRGVTNGMSAMASAQANHSPMVVLGGRAPALRWGQGSLQEIDHVPFVRPLCQLPATPRGPPENPPPSARGGSPGRSTPRWRRGGARRWWTSRWTTFSWRGPTPARSPATATS